MLVAAPIVCGGGGGFCYVFVLFCGALRCFWFCNHIISLGKRELVALLLLCSECHVTVAFLWLFLAVPWAGLWCVIVALPSHTHLFCVFQCVLLFANNFTLHSLWFDIQHDNFLRKDHFRPLHPLLSQIWLIFYFHIDLTPLFPLIQYTMWLLSEKSPFLAPVPTKKWLQWLLVCLRVWYATWRSWKSCAPGPYLSFFPNNSTLISLWIKCILTIFWTIWGSEVCVWGLLIKCYRLLQTSALTQVLFEPVHEISNNVVCATSKASDQPAHTRSLIRAFACRLSILWLLIYWLNTIWSF